MFSERFVFFGFSFDTTAQQWLDGFSLNLHQQRRLCSVFVNGGTPIIGTPKIQDGGDLPSWILTPKCKKAIFSKTKQFRAMVSTDDL